MDEQVQVRIQEMNARGWGVGTYSTGKVEVIGGLPGEELLVQLNRKRRGKWKANLLEVLQPSPERVVPRCRHVPECGGCTWQQMAYSAQLKEKERRIKNLYAPLLSHVDLRPIIACPDPWVYRNKMEFSFSQNKAGERFLGLVIAGSKGHVLNLSACHLVSPWFVLVLEQVRIWWEQSGLQAYRLNDTGTLRTLTIREGKRTGDKLMMLTVSGNPAYRMSSSQLKSLIKTILSCFPEKEHDRISIFLRIQQIHKGAPTQFFEMHLHGPDHLLEKMQLNLNPPIELTFKISPTSFFQPNTFQAEQLYSAALKMVGFPKKHVLDLYAGTATLGLAMAAFSEKVTAIEINPHACFDAEANKELNGLKNVEILCGDVGKKLAELQQRSDFGLPDLVIVDPPRTGLDEQALAHLKALRPKEILYVSCNPETQSSNIQNLVAEGYQLVALQPVDQFPHTPHIELIALLKS
jgi:23S rRNA (uracil1939-C5)-methyltransferase